MEMDEDEPHVELVLDGDLVVAIKKPLKPPEETTNVSATQHYSEPDPGDKG